jgi:hypothetical protein
LKAIGASLMARWPIGAREERMTDFAGNKDAEQLANPESVSVRFVLLMYGVSLLPISAGVIH